MGLIYCPVVVVGCSELGFVVGEEAKLQEDGTQEGRNFWQRENWL